ncbi:MAG: DNA polymerase III subunit delta [Candidatus Alcyoniella australis]|nr:DNA polymerase III subunit delta [Candidatus Alcyoniella australis]
MASTNLSALLDPKLAPDKLKPVYLLHGQEAFLVELVASRLTELALDNAPRDFNLDRVQAGEAKIGLLIENARTVPMMAKRRIVRIDGVDRLKDHDLGPLKDYLAAPVDSCLLLLTAAGKRAAPALTRAVNKHGATAEFKPPRERELPGWIDKLAAQRGIVLDSEGRAFLARAIGSDLGKIAAELEKVALYAGERKQIKIEDLRALVADVRIDALYKLTDHLAAGQVEQALVLVDGMLGQGTHPLQIMPLLVRHYSQLLQGVQANARGDDLSDLAASIGVRPFLIRQFIGQVRSFDEPTLEQCLRRLYQTDQMLKSSRLAPGLIMERLMLKLGRAAGTGRGQRQ